MTDPRPVHRHVWNGGVLPAWLDGHHHDDYGRLIILTRDGEARPEAGWWLIGWSDGTVTAASPWTGRHVYGPDGIAARLERAEAALAAAQALHTRVLRMEALVCAHCGHTWPCATIRALTKETGQAATPATGARQCPCSRQPDPGICPTDCGPGRPAGGHCTCVHDAEQSVRTTPNNPPTSKETP